MKSILASKTVVVALLLGIAMVALIPTGAAAQGYATMPSLGWNPIPQMLQYQRMGDQNAMRMFNYCMRYPAACRGLATTQSLNDVNQRLQQQGYDNVRRTQIGMQNSQQTTSNTNCAITGGQPYFNRYYNQWECVR